MPKPRKSRRNTQKSGRVLRSQATNMEGDGDNSVSDMDHQESTVDQETRSLRDQDVAQVSDPIVQPNNVGQAVTPETTQNVPIMVLDNNDNQGTSGDTDSTINTGLQSQFMIEVGGAQIFVSFPEWLAYQKLQQEKEQEQRRLEQKESERVERLALEREKEERRLAQEKEIEREKQERRLEHEKELREIERIDRLRMEEKLEREKIEIERQK